MYNRCWVTCCCVFDPHPYVLASSVKYLPKGHDMQRLVVCVIPSDRGARGHSRFVTLTRLIPVHGCDGFQW